MPDTPKPEEMAVGPSRTAITTVPEKPKEIEPSAMQKASELARKRTEELFRPSDKKSDAEIVLEMMNRILSRDDIEQKSRQTFDNIVAIARAHVILESMVEGSMFRQLPPIKGFRFINPSKVRDLDEIKRMIADEHGLMSSLRIACDQMTVRLVSLDGKGRQELIQLAQAFSFQIQQHEHEKSIADRMLGVKPPRQGGW